MLIVMQRNATRMMRDIVMDQISRLGYQALPGESDGRVVITAFGDGEAKGMRRDLANLPCVEDVVEIAAPYKFASRVAYRERTIVAVQGIPLGSPEIVVMAGPCTVESAEQVWAAAEAVHAAGARILRGGAFKPRTSPHSFQGLGEDGLRMLRDVADALGMPIVTECMSTEEVDLVSAYADIVQIGARNAQNFSLLKRVGKIDTPILLKRGMSTTIEEYLMAAEYILASGNPNVILCERGIRTFEHATRNTLDLSAIPVLRQASHLPIVVDPSHATGHWQYVAPMAKAAIAAGADGLLIEVHPYPETALCDGAQSLKPTRFAKMMEEIKPIAHAVGRQVNGKSPLPSERVQQ